MITVLIYTHSSSDDIWVEENDITIVNVTDTNLTVKGFKILTDLLLGYDLIMSYNFKPETWHLLTFEHHPFEEDTDGSYYELFELVDKREYDHAVKSLRLIQSKEHEKFLETFSKWFPNAPKSHYINVLDIVKSNKTYEEICNDLAAFLSLFIYDDLNINLMKEIMSCIYMLAYEQIDFYQWKRYYADEYINSDTRTKPLDENIYSLHELLPKIKNELVNMLTSELLTYFSSITAPDTDINYDYPF